MVNICVWDTVGIKKIVHTRLKSRRGIPNQGQTRKVTKRQSIVDNLLPLKFKIDQHEPHQKPGVLKWVFLVDRNMVSVISSDSFCHFIYISMP